MAQKFFSESNLKFMLYNVHEVESLATNDYFSDYTRESFDMILDTAKKIATDFMFPLTSEMDKKPPEYVGDTIKVNAAVRPFMKTSGEGGWINAMFPYEAGGQQMPLTVFNACKFMFAAANYSLSVYPGLTTGATGLIYSFGIKELQEKFAQKMVSGEWQGTMALTEPEAGSSLSDVRTMATPTEHGYYMIKGQKTFISAGDHDGVDNIVHLMLARIKGAPPGVKGLSLFVVPKKRIDDKGRLEFNDVNCAGCYHKMGYRGAPIAQLAMGESDDCRGYLVGEAHRGLAYMFQMMNEARIDVGLGATGIASAAYHASLEYSRERLQGRKATEKDPTKPQIPIIEHADIKRMLLVQRAIVEGSLSLVIYTGKLVDLAHVSRGEKKEEYELLLDFLTPIVKTYPSEMGLISTSQAIQIFGGYGYSDEFPVEQYLRDVRIHPIHEGTTGIQGMDLLGRKTTMKNGKAMLAYLSEVAKTINAAKGIAELAQYGDSLDRAIAVFKEVTTSLIGIAMKGETDRFLADATLFLEFAGIICIGWQWLIQGIAAQKELAKSSSEYDRKFLEGKIYVMKYYFEYELPKIEGLRIRLMKADGLTVAMSPDHFTD
jgi:alkylation response protein AidB-like acyl-CoA dehydrogenase